MDCRAILSPDLKKTGSGSATLCPLLKILVPSGELHVPRVRGRRHQHDHRTGGNGLSFLGPQDVTVHSTVCEKE